MNKNWRQNIKYEYLVSGLAGGVASTVILHPFDLIKTRFQEQRFHLVNDGTKIPNRQIYNGVINAFTTIFKENGMKGLYQGVSPNVVGAGSSWGIYFFSFNFLKASMRDWQHVENLSAGSHLIAGAIAGGSTLTLTNPVWVVKTRMCLQLGANSTNIEGREVRYTNVFDGLVKLYKSEGIKGYYRGFIPGLFGVSHGALQFMAYEELKKISSSYTGKPVDSKHAAFEYITMAALSKVFAVITTYPYQVVRSRLQDTQMQDRYNGILDILRKIYRYEGMTGFYKGLFPSLLRVTPACCITFLVFENMSHLMIVRKEIEIT